MYPHVVSFRFSYRVGGMMAFRLVSRLVGRLVCVGVPLLVLSLVSCCRPVRVSWVSVLVSAFRFSSRVCVTCRRAFRVGVVLLRRFCHLVFPFCLVLSRRCRRSIRVRPVVRVG